MNLLQSTARGIISITFRVSIRAVERFYEWSGITFTEHNWQDLPEGSLGRDIYDCLVAHGLRPLPYYADHDLKHMLLGFGMTPVEEIRLQAFMIGNGNHSPAAWGLFLLGALLLPDEWRRFHHDYRRGKAALPISSWTMAEYAGLQTAELQDRIFRHVPAVATRAVTIGFATCPAAHLLDRQLIQ